MGVTELFDNLLKKLNEEKSVAYYDTATGMPLRPLAIGEMVAMAGARAVAVGTRLGVFLAYQKDANIHDPIQYTCASELDHALGLPEMTLTFNDFNRVFHPTENVGIWLELVYQRLLATDET